jgi:hypothetical protein
MNEELPLELTEILHEKLLGEIVGEAVVQDDEPTIGKYVRLKRAKGDDSGKLAIPGTTLGEKLEAAFRLTTAIPHESEYGYKLLAAYSSLPSALCNILPILELRGEPESGKTQAIKTLAAITGSTLNARSTAASIKNDINSIRWVDPTTFSLEKNCFYLLDNSDKEFFEERDVLTAFLNGYDRDSDKQSISLGKGQNQPFYVFCPKVITTVWRIESPEIRRRLLTIKFKSKMNISRCRNIKKLALNSIKKELFEFWNVPQNWELFETLQSEVEESIPSTFTKQQWLLVVDLIAAGCATATWDSIQTAIDYFNQYFESRKNAKEGVYESLLISALTEISGIPQADWASIPKGIKVEVDPLKLKQKLETFVDAGLIPRLKPDQLQSDIRGLGFTVASKGGKFVYTLRSSS